MRSVNAPSSWPTHPPPSGPITHEVPRPRSASGTGDSSYRLLTDQLEHCHPSSSREFIGTLNGLLEGMDGRTAEAARVAKAQQRGQVIEMGDFGLALPPGAAQCPKATYQASGPIHLATAGSVFTSFVSTYGVTSGRYMYEVSVCTAGSLRLGVCGPMTLFPWDERSGVGSFPFSVGYDGSECKLWNVGSTPAGWKWARGDTITITFDLDIGEVTYYQNGKRVVSCNLPTVRSLMAAGIAHSDRDVQMCYFPAVSLAPWQQCRITVPEVLCDRSA